MKVLYGWKAVVHTYRIPQIIPYAAIPQLFAELLAETREPPKSKPNYVK